MIKKNERGIAIIEYALLIALVALGVYAIVEWGDLTSAINGVITSISSKINPAP